MSIQSEYRTCLFTASQLLYSQTPTLNQHIQLNLYIHPFLPAPPPSTQTNTHPPLRQNTLHYSDILYFVSQFKLQCNATYSASSQQITSHTKSIIYLHKMSEGILLYIHYWPCASMNGWVHAWIHSLKFYGLIDCLSVTTFSGQSRDGNQDESQSHSLTLSLGLSQYVGS